MPEILYLKHLAFTCVYYYIFSFVLYMSFLKQTSHFEISHSKLKWTRHIDIHVSVRHTCISSISYSTALYASHGYLTTTSYIDISYSNIIHRYLITTDYIYISQHLIWISHNISYGYLTTAFHMDMSHHHNITTVHMYVTMKSHIDFLHRHWNQ
jgi:hypothetical protein